MAFDHASVNDVPKFAADPNYYFQQKVDGIRGQLVIEPGKEPWFRSRNGDALVNSSAVQVTSPILNKLGKTPPGNGPSYVVDGELLDGKWYVFDMTVIGSEKTPWTGRMDVAEQWVKQLRSAGITNVEALPTARTQDEKMALWNAIRDGGGEGVMMKRTDSPYNFGGRVSHTLKAKVRSTADVVVMAKGEKGKESATVGVHVNGKLTRVGNVSLIGKEKTEPVNVGDVIEVAYLWANPDNHQLQQAAMERKRPDKKPGEATVDQLRYVDKKVLDQTAMAGGPTPKQAEPEPVVQQQRVEPVKDHHAYDQYLGQDWWKWPSKAKTEFARDHGIVDPPYVRADMNAKERQASYQASNKWERLAQEVVDRDFAPLPPVTTLDPKTATDDELETELKRLSALARAARVEEEKATDKAGKGGILTQLDHLNSAHSRMQTKRLVDAASPLQDEMIRRLDIPERSGESYDVQRWGTAGKPTTRKNPASSFDPNVAAKTRDVYVVQDMNTVDKNESLRSTAPSSAAKAWRSRVDKWINTEVAAQDSRVYRGVALPPALMRQLVPGATLRDPGVMSTDEGEGGSQFYLDTRRRQRPDSVPVMFEILVPKGHPIVDADFGEHVLPSNTPLRVREVINNGDGTFRAILEAGAAATGPGAGGGGEAATVASGTRAEVGRRDGTGDRAAELRGRVHA